MVVAGLADEEGIPGGVGDLHGNGFAYAVGEEGRKDERGLRPGHRETRTEIVYHNRAVNIVFHDPRIRDFGVVGDGIAVGAEGEVARAREVVPGERGEAVEQ